MIKHTVKQVFKEVAESKVFRGTVYTFGTLVVVVFIFQAGVVVGFHKASFGRDWGDNYSRNFGPGRQFRFLKTAPENFPNAHGVIGKVIKNDPPILLVEDHDDTERAVIVNKDTVIRKMRDTGTAADLIPDTSIIVIGNPNADGQIEAKLIRIMPSDANILFQTIPPQN
jgi:hypothetical protein